MLDNFSKEFVMEDHDWQFLDEENYVEHMAEENFLNEEEDYLHEHSSSQTGWECYYSDVSEQEIEY